MAHCLLTVGDMNLVVSYAPRLEEGQVIYEEDDHTVQISDNMGAIARTRTNEQDALLLVAAFCVLDEDTTTQHLAEMWRNVFPQEAFNP